MIKARLAKLRGRLKAHDLDGLLITLPANRRYFSGFTPDDGQWGETSGALLISQDAALLLTDFRYELTAREQATLFETVIYKRGLPGEVATQAMRLGLSSLGFEVEAMLVSWQLRIAKNLADTELVPTEALAATLRCKKNAVEIKALQKSLSLMEQVLGEVLASDIVGKSERELALTITRALEDNGAEGVAFNPTVASGPNAAEPHAESGPRIIRAGEPVLFDVGAKVDGYCSDISRTVVAGGLELADDKFKEIYGLTRQAQLKAMAGIRPGMTGGEADAIARKVIADGGFGERFGHSLGHGVGLATHEDPGVGPNSPDLLQPGMVFTIEPGIYLPGWGGVRLEDMMLLGEDGCQRLGALDWFYDLD